MIKVVRVTFDCDERFRSGSEVLHAINSHMVQIYKKAALVDHFNVEEMPPEVIEAQARIDLAISIDNLTESLNRYRIEGKLT